MDGEVGAKGDRESRVLASRQRDSWTRLYHQYRAELRKYFQRHVQCPSEVDDLVQDVFTAAMAQGSPPQHPRAFLGMIAGNRLFTTWRRRRLSAAQRSIISAHSDLEAADDEDRSERGVGSLEQAWARERTEIILRLVTELPPASKEALCLRVFNGLSVEAAARRARCSGEAIQKRLQRAKRSLARAVRNQDLL